MPTGVYHRNGSPYGISQKDDKAEYLRRWKEANKDKVSEHGKRTYSKHHDERVLKNREYYNKNREEIQEKVREKRKEDPLRYKEHNLRSDHDMSLKAFVGLFMSQDCRCAICQTPFQNYQSACVDHDHQSGKIRALLCSKCNMAIGLFQDDFRIVREAARYLARYSADQYLWPE
jgi:hypothetical protein